MTEEKEVKRAKAKWRTRPGSATRLSVTGRSPGTAAAGLSAGLLRSMTSGMMKRRRKKRRNEAERQFEVCVS